MGNFRKTYMLYYLEAGYYSWAVHWGNDPKVTGELDGTFFNRQEGYEALYFINKYMKNHHLWGLSSFQKIERIIRRDVPEDICSQENIEHWIASNWYKC
jgi:hypothetical protein